MKNIDEIISALHDGTLQESETIEFKRSLPKDFPLIERLLSVLLIVEEVISFLVLQTR